MKERFEEARLVATITVGIVTAEVYLDEGGYNIFLVGDNVKVFIGCFPSIEHCQREIEWLRQVGESEIFKQAARTQSTALETRRDELAQWLEEQRTRVSTAERLPGAIQSFLTDFESLDVRHQKAQLQAILKSAYVYRDERIELEFRG